MNRPDKRQSLARRVMDGLERRRIDWNDRMVRQHLKRKRTLRWWLVYGAARTGTTYMVNLVAGRSRLKVSDWCLGNMLRLTPPFEYVRFDTNRALRNISDNILDHAWRGAGHDLDLAYKQSQLDYQEYERLIQMWGRPERLIFCYRQPAGCIASSTKHFSGDLYIPVPRLQERYVQQFESYKQIGGDPFEYCPLSTVQTYVDFLKPLAIDSTSCKPFRYHGEDNHELTTKEMWRAFHDFRTKYDAVSQGLFGMSTGG